MPTQTVSATAVLPRPSTRAAITAVGMAISPHIIDGIAACCPPTAGGDLTLDRSASSRPLRSALARRFGSTQLPKIDPILVGRSKPMHRRSQHLKLSGLCRTGGYTRLLHVL